MEWVAGFRGIRITNKINLGEKMSDIESLMQGMNISERISFLEEELESNGEEYAEGYLEEKIERLEEEIIEQNVARRQKNIELLNQQKAVNGVTLIDKYKEDYETALSSIDVDIKQLIEQGHDMKGLFLFQENVVKILEIHRILDSLYNIIFTQQEVLWHYNSKRISQIGHDLIRLRTQVTNLSEIGPEFVERLVSGNLEEVGYNKEHWYLKPVLINEIEYLLEVLPLLIEPDFIPFEQNTDDDTTDPKTDRYISKCVKISVWRRDCGKCVECGSQEKLEYDHIIPVAKGGSNTERNVQLLCEKCNRQKSANIQ